MSYPRSQTTLLEKIGATLLAITFSFWAWQAKQVVEESKQQHKDVALLQIHEVHQDDILETHGKDIDYLKARLSNNGRAIVQQQQTKNAE